MMDYALIKGGLVRNVIVAGPDFVGQIADDWDHIEALDTLHEQGLGVGIGWAWSQEAGFVAPAQPAPQEPQAVRRITKRAFQDRFPLAQNGVSRKYDLMSLFMKDDGYAASLGVSGAALYELRAMIVTGLNRLNASSHVDLDLPDAANFTMLLLSPGIPNAFRLTAEERTAILTAPVQEGEQWRG